MINLTYTTNRIIYNRLKRGVVKILNHNVFELNDKYTRYKIDSELRQFLKKAKTHAIKDYKMEISPYNESKPHYIDLHITLYFKNIIEHVFLNVNNVDTI